jgi:hypothetical protein
MLVLTGCGICFLFVAGFPALAAVILSEAQQESKDLRFVPLHLGGTSRSSTNVILSTEYTQCALEIDII